MHLTSPRLTFVAIFLAATAIALGSFLWAPRWLLYAAAAPVAVLAVAVALALPKGAPAPKRSKPIAKSDEESSLEIVSVVHARPEPRPDPVAAVVQVPPSSARAPLPRDERAVPQAGYYPNGLPASAPIRPPSSDWARSAPPPRPVVARGPPPMQRVVSAPSSTPPPPGFTRGQCSQCGTILTLSARRPILATCPVCGHSKQLN